MSQKHSQEGTETERNIHAGRRERLKRRMMRQGLSGFEPHEVLELLLGYSIPRRDTNPIAHRLIRRFGSLRGVFSARIDELMTVEGVGEHSAVLIGMIPQVMTMLALSDPSMPVRITSTEEARSFVRPHFIGTQAERLLLVYLGNKNQVLGTESLSEGSLSTIAVNTRLVVELVIRNHATGLLLAHNHPGGHATPSAEDMETTNRLQAVLAPMQVALLDHIIVAEDECFSMREADMLHL